MMNVSALVEQWKKQLNDPKRARLYFFLSFVVLYFIWFILLFNPQRVAKNKLKIQIQTRQAQMMDAQQQIDAINQAIKTESIANAIQTEQLLAAKLQNVQQQLVNIKPLFASQEDWVKVKKEVIGKQSDMDNSITLVSMSDPPPRPWMPVAVAKTDIVNSKFEGIEVHSLEVKFQADYFSTMQYLSRLEKLPWPIYWDSLQYTVQAYPKADVILKFHIFTKQSTV